MLLQLPPFAQVPGPDRVVQAAGPELGAIVRNVNTAGPVCVALELPEEHTQEVLRGYKHTHTHIL